MVRSRAAQSGTTGRGGRERTPGLYGPAGRCVHILRRRTEPPLRKRDCGSGVPARFIAVAKVLDSPNRPLHQSALAEFGISALRMTELDPLLHEACVHVARALDVPIAKLAIRQPESSDLMLKACVG